MRSRASGPDIEYSTIVGVNSVAVHRFASITGWSYARSGDLLWTAPGKIYPPKTSSCAGLFGECDEMAVYWGDPQMAVGLLDKSLVVYSFLGGSTTLFDSKTAGGDIYNDWPGKTPGGLIDSVCVAFSHDGGITFTATVCKQLPGPVDHPLGSDQDTVGIDGSGRVFVAAEGLRLPPGNHRPFDGRSLRDSTFAPRPVRGTLVSRNRNCRYDGCGSDTHVPA